MKVKNIPIENYGYGFLDDEFLPSSLSGLDEYWLRNAQQAQLFSRKPEDWRHLKPEEIEQHSATRQGRRASLKKQS